MSGLVEKVRDKVRGRSRSRRSTIENNAKSSTEFQRSDNASARQSQDLTHPSQLQRGSSPSTPAWHVHKGAAGSTDAPAPPVPSVDPVHYNNTARTQADGMSNNAYTPQYGNSAAAENVPTRFSSLNNPVNTQERGNLGTPSQNDVPYPYTVPRRKESLSNSRSHQRNANSIDQTRSHQRNANSMDQTRSNQSTNNTLNGSNTARNYADTDRDLPVQRTGGDLGTEIDQALASLSSSDRNGQHQARSRQSGVQVDEPLEHLRVPRGFNLGHTEHTDISTTWKPAVTHENIYHEKTEIIREAISRDIHVHHYYTYVQPIKVVEVLPARHFQIDERTGAKVEIVAPAGWEMPRDLNPRTEDITPITGWSRHYLVNEQYPRGIAEPPPTSHQNHGLKQQNGTERVGRAF